MVGGGQMGTGIAQVAAIAGQQVFSKLIFEENSWIYLFLLDDVLWVYSFF